MPKRRYPVSPTGLEAAKAHLAKVLKDRGIHFIDIDNVTRALLKAYFAGRRSTEVMGRGYAPQAWLLANMEIGESKVIPHAGGAIGLRQLMPTARGIMENVEAKWRAANVPGGGIYVTRLADGVTVTPDPLRNPKVLELATMGAGETKISGTLLRVRGKGGPDSWIKMRARQVMAAPRADWRFKKDSAGVRITRIL